MTIGRFRHFLAVADEASFGRAAARLGMKQPPLSQSVRRLERDLGVTLLERTSKGVTLTRAGDAFLPEARAAVAAAERAAALAREAAGPRRPVRVGFVAVAMWDILPSLLDAAHTADIPVRLYQDTTYNQLNALAEGRLDLGFVAPPFEAPSRLRVENLADEPVMVATPTALVPDEGGPVALAAIAGHLIMYPRSEGTVLYRRHPCHVSNPRLEARHCAGVAADVDDIGIVGCRARRLLCSGGALTNCIIEGRRLPLSRLIDTHTALAGLPGAYAPFGPQRYGPAARSLAALSAQRLVKLASPYSRAPAILERESCREAW